MRFTIKAEYTTGDSNGSSLETRVMSEFTWEKEEAAKAALQRLAEHYKWYKEKDRTWGRSPHDKIPEEPAWHKGMNERELEILLDNGNPVHFRPPWLGYFEHLQALEIILDNSDWRVEF